MSPAAGTETASPRLALHEPVRHAQHGSLGDDLEAAAPVQAHVAFLVRLEITDGAAPIELLDDRRHQGRPDPLPLQLRCDRRRTQVPVIDVQVLPGPAPQPAPYPRQ